MEKTQPKLDITVHAWMRADERLHTKAETYLYAIIYASRNGYVGSTEKLAQECPCAVSTMEKAINRLLKLEMIELQQTSFRRTAMIINREKMYKNER